MNVERDMTPEEQFIDNIDTLELHHGPYSTSAPYTEIEVLGCRLTTQIRAALGEIGFSEFDEHDSSFIARRTQEHAALRR